MTENEFLDLEIPFDIKIGAGTSKAGTSVRALMARLQVVDAILSEGMKDAARWQALKQCEGELHWWCWDNVGFKVHMHAHSKDFGGLDQAMDYWIAKLKERESCDTKDE